MKNIKFLLILFLFSALTKAQDKETTLLEINNTKYSLEEFNYIYDKNNSISKDPLPKEDYLDLFVNYKLKVTEAISMGLDTMPNFKKELRYYRNELAKPYLTDKKATEKVAKEAYERMLEEIDVSHILIRLPKDPFPGDTLKAYNKAKEIREKIIGGADFEEMATKFSEDPSVKNNKGRLGYITVFQTVYPFETAAYTTPVGEISPVIRTSFGYHILKVNNKRKSPGEIKVAHIMKVIPRNATQEAQQTAKHQIDSIYEQLQKGEDFKTLAQKFSDDRTTAPKGGELNWFGTGRMIPEFAEAAFKLENNGDYSKPVRTRVGWHIIKRIDRRDIKPYEEQKDYLLKKVTNSKRALSGKKATIKKLKKENGFSYDTLTTEFIKNIFTKKGITREQFLAELKSQKPLCTVADTTFQLSSFAEYLSKDRNFMPGQSPLVLDKKLNEFFNDKIIEWESEHLDEKYPEFEFLITEYHDGLLIFDISQKEIWNKASADSSGLHNYYEEHKSRYATPQKFNGYIFFCKNSKTVKAVKDIVKDSVTQSKIDSLKSMPKYKFIVKSGEFEKGEDKLYDAVLWNVRTKKKPEYPGKLSKTCFFGNFEESRQQSYEDVKGLVIADYQTYIEKNWVNSLKEKYKPVVHREVLKKHKK